MFSLDIVFWKTKFMNWLGDVKYRLFGRDVSSLRKQNFEQEVERTIQEFAQENLSFQSKAIFEGWRVALSLSLKLIIVGGGLADTSWTQSRYLYKVNMYWCFTSDEEILTLCIRQVSNCM